MGTGGPKWKDFKSRKNLYMKSFTYVKNFYVHKIAAVNLSKIYFLKNAKRTCKPNNRDWNRDWKSNLEHKLCIFEVVISNTKWKDFKSSKKLYTKNFTYTKKFYVHKIAAVNLSKTYLRKNAMKTCKSNNRDLNRDWKRLDIVS